MITRVGLPLEQWPEQDRKAWEHATAPAESLFGAGAAAARLRPQSVETYRKAYGLWLGFLYRRGWLNDTMSAAEAVTHERLNAYVAEQRERGNGNATIKINLVGLHAALRLMVPEADFGFVRCPGGLPLDRALPSTPKRVSVRDFRELLGLACQLHQLGLSQWPRKTGKMAIRDAAILGLLALRGPRAGSLAAMEIGGHLTRNDSGYWVWLGEYAIKTPISIFYPLDDVLTPVFDAYLNDVRPLFGGDGTVTLWLGAQGGALSADSISHIVRKRTMEWFGESRGPHWFRKCLTTTVAMESPEFALDTAFLLGHSPRVSLKNYNMGCATAAMRRHNKCITARRKATRGLAARAFQAEELNSDAVAVPQRRRR